MEIPNGVSVVLAQAVELPDFSNLPPYAQGIMYTVAAIALGLSIVVPRIGFLFGKKDTKPDPGPAVAAVVVDPSALLKHAEAVNKLATAMRALTSELDRGREDMRVAREIEADRQRRN